MILVQLSFICLLDKLIVSTDQINNPELINPEYWYKIIYTITNIINIIINWHININTIWREQLVYFNLRRFSRKSNVNSHYSYFIEIRSSCIYAVRIDI